MKAILFASCLLVIAGCGTSSPRFAGKESSSKGEPTEKKTAGPRFSSKHVEEERAEDDRKVDVKGFVARFSSAGWSQHPPAPKPPMSQGHPEKAAANHEAAPGAKSDQKMMDVILSYLGTPYVYGGDSKSGIDCSAFTEAVYAQSTSVTLPRTTAEQVRLGQPVSREDLKFGDLMFFNTTGTNPSHVGIYIGDDLFAHASEAFGVTISSIESSYYKKRYTEARRILD
ncbi:MAG TPA: NlpC/P60 family protein [Bacteroidota bacterium]|nr:NlpC/P60 family protein [Bacteroidota bacterium]